MKSSLGKHYFREDLKEISERTSAEEEGKPNAKALKWDNQCISLFEEERAASVLNDDEKLSKMKMANLIHWF